MHVSYVKSYEFESHCLPFYRLIDMLYFFICFHFVFSYSRFSYFVYFSLYILIFYFFNFYISKSFFTNTILFGLFLFLPLLEILIPVIPTI